MDAREHLPRQAAQWKLLAPLPRVPSARATGIHATEEEGGMSVTKWTSPLTEARPPARPRTFDWLCVLVWLAAPLAFWLAAGALILYLIGVV
jgi:hypothetical protein